MRHRLTILLLALSCFLLRQTTDAQSRSYPLVSEDFNQLSTQQILLQLEKQTGFRFFYDTTYFDTSKVNLSVKTLPLPQVLDKLFFDSNTAYAIDDQNNIFITKGTILKTKLPRSFFSSEATSISDTVSEDHLATKDDDKVYMIGQGTDDAPSGRYIINGYIKDIKTGEPVIGASVQVAGSAAGSATDQFGYYTLMVPAGPQTINVQSIGMEDARRRLIVRGDGRLNIEMGSRILTLKNVTISAQKVSNIRNTQLGLQRIDIKTIKQVPVVFGEADILRVVLTTPGVKTVGEASTGLNVRGGSTDQNLILFNDLNIYNPSHFFGMFSAFNPEVVKDVELYKASIPARYGGRLSSVVDINSREGNKKTFAGSAGIGLLTSRVNIEGPLIKDKSSFILGGRTTYTNWLLKNLPDQYKNSEASFYDVNLILNHEFDKKNTLYLTAYTSNDRFNLNSDTAYRYNNKNVSLKWKHSFNNRLYAIISGGYDRYQYEISSDKNPVNAYSLNFDINQSWFRTHFNYFINAKHSLEFGLNTSYHKLHPGDYGPVGEKSLIAPVTMPAEQALESALYLSDKYNISPSLTLDAGIRYSVYNFLGPASVNNYPAGVPKTIENITGVTDYKRGQIIHTYQGPEVRLGLRQMLSNTMSLKLGYTTLRQYIHMLSNTAAMAPTDIWKLSDPNIHPQFGEQYSMGLFKNLKENTIEISLEGYYKRIKNYLDFKSGAVLLLNPHVETEVMRTNGKAYGVEFQVKKLTGKLNGWISYTYSRILLKADQAATGEYINQGRFYPANYDKPHDATLVGNYRVSHRFSFSLNSTYSTGRPITLPIGRFYYSDGMRTLYGDRNAHRIPDYFRADAAMNIEGNHKLHQRTHNSWTIGVYNITGRKNPYSVYYTSENGVVNGYKLSIFGSAIPYINFNIRF